MMKLFLVVSICVALFLSLTDFSGESPKHGESMLTVHFPEFRLIPKPGSRRNAKRGSELMGVDMLFLEESFPFPFKRPTAYFGEQKQTATWSTLKDRSQEAQRVMLTIRLERDVTVCVCLTPWLAFITNLKATEVNQVLSLEEKEV
ncbi:hypothetical protein F2Q70_00008717 [Brassica cretica]|uniref:Uncharacterized protein n=1 Tax=Brassica cretica TaxID=69181 RepID=A0A8S9M6S6_BRACR|nr:hypothetical protein F2Q70_00008717 [Brassica cretica]